MKDTIIMRFNLIILVLLAFSACKSEKTQLTDQGNQFWDVSETEVLPDQVQPSDMPNDEISNVEPAPELEEKIEEVEIDVDMKETTVECIPEGKFGKDGLDCCEGLGKISCDYEESDGKCQKCTDVFVCAKCGDGKCGTGENKCNCPQDCKEEKCLGLGAKFLNPDPEGKCCEGLVAMVDSLYEGPGDCKYPKCPCYICIPCGDGTCGAFEHECNCPADCGVEKCIPEGGTVPLIPNPPKCCEGLEPIPCDYPDSNGSCNPCLGGSVCAKCGDNICGTGENLCNCPEDCKHPETCAEEGEYVSGSKECCGNLNKIACSKPMPDGTCSECKDEVFICAKCPDGECGKGESSCNCPQDCKPSTCVEEGGTVPVVPNAPECCDGLTKVSCSKADDNGECTPCLGASVCVKCGDGNCGKGENKCNCPEDCKETPKCVQYGGKYIGSENKCCEGLEPADDIMYDGPGLCSPLDCLCKICLPCGNGKCEDLENECNCPKDCPPLKCVEEGGHVAVYPNSPTCCEGLKKIPCDAPNIEDQCQTCVGSSICAKCGDGECGKGENKCNCPEDCGKCLGLGETFIDFNTDGKCCSGLTPAPDCDISENGCLCKKCPCHICVACGDGVCGPFEHVCNCPEDCPDDKKCVKTYMSTCQGNPYGVDPVGKIDLKVIGHDIIFSHKEVALNCCIKVQVCFTQKSKEIYAVEKNVEPIIPCFCQCLYNIDAVLEGIKSGTYKFILENEQMNKTIFTTELTIP